MQLVTEMLEDPLSSRRLNIMKFSRAISRVKWLNSKKQEDHLCPRPQCADMAGQQLTKERTKSEFLRGTLGIVPC
jgi:hypothetical protein